jgi:[acyl-carrier-protein] S-malonyltransferase
MARALLFPGQGSQSVGMGKALADTAAEARAVFEAVDDALDTALSRIIFEGPEDQLQLTANAQPALMATSIAALRVLEARSGRKAEELCRFVAGHSLGEYSALTAAGALDIGATARLVRLRGEAMQAAVPVGAGAMAAIIGLDLAAVEEIAAAASVTGACDVANDNAPGQVVVSGTRAAVERAVELAKERGARRSMLLPVSAPFHCRLMAPAARTVEAALAGMPLGAPVVPVVCNVSATAETEPLILKDRLVRQVMGRVRFRESVAALSAAGVDQVVELGAGRVLAGLARRTVKDMRAISIGAPEEVDAFVADLDREAAA